MTWRESWEDGNQGGGAQLSFPRITSAIKILLLINAAVFVVNFFVFLSSESTLTPWLGLSLRTLEERPFLGLMNLITYQFTHSIDVWHILMNSLVLYFFGTMVEREYGPRQLVRLYLLSGIAGGLFWLVFSGINGQAAVPVIGASGSAYGILIYAAFMQPHARVLLLILFVPLWAVAALFGFLALYETLISLRIDSGGTAHAAHLGGAVFGALWWKARPWLQQQRYKAQARVKEKERGRERDEQQEIDRLLAKVKAQGMASLSKSERKTLTRYSEKLKG